MSSLIDLVTPPISSVSKDRFPRTLDDLGRVTIADVCPWVHDHVSQMGSNPPLVLQPSGWMSSQTPNLLGIAPYLTPRTDVKENKESYSVAIEMPGAKKEHINIDLTADCLTVTCKCSGMVRSEDDTDETFFLKRERPRSLRKTLCLPKELCDTSKATSYLKNGVLNITIPKCTGRTGQRSLTIGMCVCVAVCLSLNACLPLYFIHTHGNPEPSLTLPPSRRGLPPRLSYGSEPLFQHHQEDVSYCFRGSRLQVFREHPFPPPSPPYLPASPNLLHSSVISDECRKSVHIRFCQI